ncbi:MAG TPA: hypothetical protein PLB25_03620 [Rhodoferax sp.]|nr:hypothetical protein [Rhodoferax sp.]
MQIKVLRRFVWYLTQAGERGRCLQSAVQPDQGRTNPPEGLGLDAVAWLSQLKNACRIRALRRQALVGKGVTFHELTVNVANLSWSFSGVSSSKRGSISVGYNKQSSGATATQNGMDRSVAGLKRRH